MHKKITLMLAGFMFLFTSSCGTILHPTRIGKVPSGNLDLSIVALNSIGVLFFIIPGVIAFSIDHATGALYDPEY